MSMNWSVSVVIPSFNAEKTIERAILSVLTQTVKVSEIILVDDCSSDSTLDVIKRIIKDNSSDVHIYLVRSPSNKGPGCARNLGLDKVQSRFVAFLDADDIWHPYKIQMQLEFFQKNPLISLSAHASDLWNGRFPKVTAEFRTGEIRLFNLLLRNSVGTRTVMMKSDVKIRFKNRRFSEDYLFWLSCLQAGYRFGYIHLTLAYTFRQEFSPGGYSGDLFKQEMRELRTYCEFFKSQSYYGLLIPLFTLYSLFKYLRRVGLRYIKR